MGKLKKLLPFLLLIVLSSLVVVQLFPVASPYAGIRLPLDVQTIQQRSRDLLADFGISSEGLTAQAQLKSDQSLFRELEQRYGVTRSNELMQAKVSVQYWDVTWRKSSAIALAMKQEDDPARQGEQVAAIIRGDVFMRLSTGGSLMEFERKIPDSVSLPTITQPEARSLANTFLHKYAAAGTVVADTAQPGSEKKTEQKKRVDYEFTWSARTPELDNPVNITVSVAGNSVVHLQAKTDIPEEYKKSDVETASQIAIPIVYFLLIIIMTIVAFRRFRSFELGFRLATIIGVISAVFVGLQIYLTMRSDQGWEMLISLILGPVFYGGGLVVVWAVGESVARESWKEKLISFDLLSKGYGYHSRVGESVVRGIALGLGSLALMLSLVYASGKILPMWVSQMDEAYTETFGAFASWLYVLGRGVSANSYKVAIIVLFSLSFFRRRFSSDILIIVLGAVVMALTTQGNISPVWIGMTIEMFVGVVIVWGFYRYDALTAFLSLITMSVVQQAGGLLAAGNPTYTQSGVVILGFLAALVVIGLASQTRKSEITEFDDIVPAFAKHITERQRLQQELEIARNVQMSFLPKTNPKMVELDIASRCAPALEVGGDYYDFIDLPEKRLGVVVGDVSGKGTQAAFFMTLTKGFVHALAEVSNSPSAVLTQVNKLFYENVDRGVFISMVYGVFDIPGRILTLARAGHNPVIMRKTQANQVQIVNPMGLALGLDPGATFSKSIQEVTIPFQSGDLFVFYTDGFPEAMNKTLEEFGEERLCQTVQKYAVGTAAEIMDGVFADMRQFVGKAKQHDDMTIVVVKVV